MSDVPLRQYIEERLDDYKSSHDRQHLLEDKARSAAQTVLDHRLQNLNQLRDEVIEDRGSYLRTDVYESRHIALSREVETKMETLHAASMEAHKRLEASIAELQAWRNKSIGAGVVLTLGAGAIGAAIVRAIGG